jgi:fructose-bisphosphate aldolase class I
VEPEVLIDGPHSQAVFGDVSARAISTCITHLWREGVTLEGCLLKPQMVVPVGGS